VANTWSTCRFRRKPPIFSNNFVLPNSSYLSHLGNPHVYTVAVTIAIIASLETLLSLEATDKLDPLKRLAPTNRELKAQGVGNIISGLLGGLPITPSSCAARPASMREGKPVWPVSLMACFCCSASCFSALPELYSTRLFSAIYLHTGYKLGKSGFIQDVLPKGHESISSFRHLP